MGTALVRMCLQVVRNRPADNYAAVPGADFSKIKPLFL